MQSHPERCLNIYTHVMLCIIIMPRHRTRARFLRENDIFHRSFSSLGFGNLLSNPIATSFVRRALKRFFSRSSFRYINMGAASNDSSMKVSKEEMKRAGIDLAYRDFCAHLLIPLIECRRKSFFLPWKCGDERHAYEKCQYEE